MEWLACLLWLQLLLLLLDVATVRDRLSKLARLSFLARQGDDCKASEQDRAGALEGYELICSEGVTVPTHILLQALSYARQVGATVLDLVPEDAGALDLFSYLQLLDVDKVRKRPFETGRSAGLALLVAGDVLRRIHPDGTRPAYSTPASLVAFAKRLKRHAAYAYNMVLCPGLAGASLPWRSRWAALWAHVGSLAVQALLFPFLLTALVAWGVWGGRPCFAVCLLLLYQLQPVLALGNGGVSVLLPLLRLPIELFRSASTVISCEPPVPAVEPGSSGGEQHGAARRAEYENVLAEGLSRFFEPRRGDCPLCGSERLGQLVCSPDHIQYKPGLFHLSRCGDCGHVFQNPRLSQEGLSFYYRDAYEGLNTATMEWIYDIQEARYLDRAKMLTRCGAGAAAAVVRWLDVGGCHGHFCCAARQLWPNTQFELLDWAEAVEEAGRRGWADKVHRGQFLQLAGTLEGRFDVVSMSHYLEHTTEPWAEVDAAWKVLKEGGRLFIELPDPECRLGTWMGSLWQSWLQPQHLHLPPLDALEALLRRHGFEVVARERREAHIRSDVTFCVAKALNCVLLSPELSGAPWLPQEPSWQRPLRHLAWWLPGGVLLALGWLLDVLGGSLLLRLAGSNTYRILAVRQSP